MSVNQFYVYCRPHNIKISAFLSFVTAKLTTLFSDPISRCSPIFPLLVIHLARLSVPNGKLFVILGKRQNNIYDSLYHVTWHAEAKNFQNCDFSTIPTCENDSSEKENVVHIHAYQLSIIIHLHLFHRFHFLQINDIHKEY